MKKWLLVLIVRLLTGPMAISATYYMPDDCANLHECFGVMSGGDTLIIRDGMYTGEENVIDAWHHYPPSGSASNYTIIRAEHSGRIIFDGENVRNMFNYISNAQYISFFGIVWGRTTGSCIYVAHSDHIKFQQCGAFDAAGTASGIAFHTCSYILIEDSYIWGHFYYGINPYHCDHFILRRVISRLDHGSGPWLADFAVYGCSDVELQNCIAIDTDNINYYHVDSDIYAFYNPNNGDGTDRGVYRGCIALNIKAPYGGNDMPAYSATISQDCHDYRFYNCVFWDNGRGIWDRSGETSDGAIVRNSLLGRKSSTYGWASIVRSRVYNSLILESKLAGIEMGISDYNCFYNNDANYRNLSPGIHDYCSENGNETNPYENGLKYLPRIEEGSFLATAGEDGGKIGPDITKKIGRSGTLWGEEGYNETTDEPLWPFPNEDLIKEKMSAYTYDQDGDGSPEITGKRGFCADGAGLYGGRITLTSYIWEYLGNPCPVDVCNYYDVNRDRHVNVQDTQIVANHILGIATSENADTTGDGSVNIQDVQGVVNVILAGKQG